MAIYRHWPLIKLLITKYFDESHGWTSVTEWDAEDLVHLELFANAELQRRGALLEGKEFVRGNRTVH